jgi:hypothetical protein
MIGTRGTEDRPVAVILAIKESRKGFEKHTKT